MFGFKIFYNLFINLNIVYQNKVIGNIFSIENVSVSSVSLLKNGISFKLFSNDVFYNYVFIVGSGNSCKTMEERIVKEIIYINDIDLDIENYYFICCLYELEEEISVYRLLLDYI